MKLYTWCYTLLRTLRRALRPQRKVYRQPGHHGRWHLKSN